MKGLVGLAVVGVIACAVTVWIQSRADKDYGVPIGVAFGTPPSGQYEMHVIVDPGMMIAEPAPKSKDITPKLDEWMNLHFKLEDAGGKPVTLMRANNSRLVPVAKAGGTPEFYITAVLKPGSDYTLYYIPKTTEPRKYRYKFTAPPGAKEVQRVYFEPV